MTLPPAAPERQLKHRRQIDVQMFARGNGLWEKDTTLTGVKARAASRGEGPRPAGTPRRHALLRGSEAVHLHCPRWCRAGVALVSRAVRRRAAAATD